MADDFDESVKRAAREAAAPSQSKVQQTDSGVSPTASPRQDDFGRERALHLAPEGLGRGGSGSQTPRQAGLTTQPYSRHAEHDDSVQAKRQQQSKEAASGHRPQSTEQATAAQKQQSRTTERFSQRVAQATKQAFSRLSDKFKSSLNKDQRTREQTSSRGNQQQADRGGKGRER